MSKIVYCVNDHYELKFGGDNFNSILTWVHTLPDAKYNSTKKCFNLPITDENTRLLTTHGWQFIGDAYQKKIDPTKIKQFTELSKDSLHFPKGLASFQEDAVAFMLSRNAASLLALPMGVGKANWNETEIIVPEGSKKIKDIKVGDFVISPITGKSVLVDGVFPQKPQHLYRVSFGDGRSTLCTASHLWAVRDIQDKKKKIRIMSTEEIKAKGLRTGGAFPQNRWMVSYTAPVEWNRIEDIPLDPYFLGYMIGNGRMPKSDKSSILMITTKDKEIIDYVNEYLFTNFKDYLPLKQLDNPYDYGFMLKREYRHTGMGINKGTLKQLILSLGMGSCTAEYKFIPEAYLYAPTPIRFALLQGLIDSDGSISPGGSSCEYTTISPQLAKDVIFLVRGLGGYASSKVVVNSYTYKGNKLKGRPAHRIYITIPEGIGIPSRLPRKANIFIPKKAKTMGIISIEKEMEKGKCTCIHVADEHNMYLVDDFIPTHNTVISAAYCGMAARKVIVVCPATIKEQWSRELKKWADFRSVILEGRTPYDISFSSVDAIILNYEIVYAWERSLRGKAEWILVDECQKLANPTTKQSKALITLCRKAPHRIFISGTPARNRPRELFTVLNLIDPVLFNDRYAFYNRYCDPKPGFQGRMTYDGSTNAKELSTLMAPYMFRRTKEAILPHLPKKHKVIYSFDVKKTESYKKTEAQLIAAIKGRGKDRQELLEKTYLEAYTLKSEAIFEKIDEWLEENPTEKLVIMAYHTIPVEEIYSRYKAIAVKVSGSTPTKQRQSLVDQFQNDKKTRIFVGQMLAAGVGLTLTAARTMMFAELWYVPGDMEQASDRIHRFTSTGDSVEYIYFVAAHTVEDKMMKAVEQKSQWLSEIMDGATKEYFNADEIYDVLLGERWLLKGEYEGIPV